MNFEVWRFSNGKDDTLGLLFSINEDGLHFLCFTLEDEYRLEKVHRETRIPAGVYKLGIRTEGGFHNRYAKKFPDIHSGMIQILNVPNFEYVLIHIGNEEDDTAGCLLVGDSIKQNVTENGFIGYSTSAYKRIYPIIISAIWGDNNTTITFKDLI